MKTVKKGRPPRKEKRHVIWLTTSTLRLWNERRKAFGLKNKSNSEFAEVLLHGMFLKRTGRFDCPDNNNNKGAQRTLVVGGPLKSKILTSTEFLLSKQTIATNSSRGLAKEGGKTNGWFNVIILGGAVASWLVRSTPDRVVWVRGLAGDIVLRSWARHFTLTVPLSTQVYKWVPA